MVVGSPLLLMVLSTIMSHSDALTCFDIHANETGYLQRKTTCEGDLCVYYQPGQQAVFSEEKSCATGFQFPLGCTNGAVDGSVMCICSTDFCNHGGIDEIVNTPQYLCSDDNAISQNGTNGSLCLMESNVHSKTYETQTLARAIKGSERFPLPPGYPDINHFNFYTGIVHTHFLVDKENRTHYYKCEGDYCNNISISALPVLKTVSCYDGASKTTTCKSEFCVFAVDTFRNLSQRFCVSTFNLHSEHSYEAGLYKYKTTSYFLCQTDGCNYNETTATIPRKVRERIIASASILWLEMLRPEYLFATLSAMSGLIFITITALAVQMDIIEFVDE